jgi:hypothetical protein
MPLFLELKSKIPIQTCSENIGTSGQPHTNSSNRGAEEVNIASILRPASPTQSRAPFIEALEGKVTCRLQRMTPVNQLREEDGKEV